SVEITKTSGPYDERISSCIFADGG
ncbi:unnamed protein product, partial [Allacma fusca]